MRRRSAQVAARWRGRRKGGSFIAETSPHSYAFALSERILRWFSSPGCRFACPGLCSSWAFSPFAARDSSAEDWRILMHSAFCVGFLLQCVASLALGYVLLGLSARLQRGGVRRNIVASRCFHVTEFSAWAGKFVSLKARPRALYRVGAGPRGVCCRPCRRGRRWCAAHGIPCGG